MEVMIAMLIMVIGVTAVIALFPIGLARVRNAVLDTRCTTMAQNAKALFDAKQMADDPALIRFDVDTTGPNPSFNPPKTTDGRPVLDAEFNNAYAWLFNETVPQTSGANLNPQSRYIFGMMPDPAGTWRYADPTSEFLTPAPTFQPLEQEVMSFPILIDPTLFEAQNPPPIVVGTKSTSHIPITDYYIKQNPSVTSPYYDIRICSLAEIRGAPAIGGAPLINAMYDGTVPIDRLRTNWVSRWFTSPQDLHYNTVNPILPLNPLTQATGANAPASTDYIRLDVNPATTNPKVTGNRTNPYSWAVLIQRPLGPDDPTHTAANRSVARPPSRSYSGGKISYLCFYKRNLARPFTVVEGCIFDGSRKITLAWPTTVERPEIRRGTWLLEASIARDNAPPPSGGGGPTNAGNRISGQYQLPGNSDFWIYRNTFNFFRVVDYIDPVIDTATNRVFQEITIDSTPRRFPAFHVNGDLRGRDAYTLPIWPMVENSTNPTPDETNGARFFGSAAGVTKPVYFPIVIFDGLREVF